jgi:DNA-directed RNA polymerase subunit E'/Rpb7
MPHECVQACYVWREYTQPVKLQTTETHLELAFVEVLSERLEGSCSLPEGFVRPKSVKYVSHSAGSIYGAYAKYMVTFCCQVYVIEPEMIISGVVKSVTKSGIRFQSAVLDPSPFTGFIARNAGNPDDPLNAIFEGGAYTYRVGDTIIARVKMLKFNMMEPKIRCVCNPLVPKVPTPV